MRIYRTRVFSLICVLLIQIFILQGDSLAIPEQLNSEYLSPALHIELAGFLDGFLKIPDPAFCFI